jgi:acyl-CoA synthetase (AMP-forming)/AMP-acid ligase II
VLVVPADGASAPTLAELREHCRTRLARFKLPEVVAYADELPHNDLGKLPRRVLLAALEAGGTGEER